MTVPRAEEVEQFKLPDFEGDPVVALAMSLTGSITCAEDQPPNVLHHGSRHVMLVEVDVLPPSFKSTDEGLVRWQKAKINRAFIVPPTEAFELLAERTAEVSKALDAMAGRAVIDGFDI